jgi:hypothetical protein
MTVNTAPTKIFIDISVFTEDANFGTVTGEIEVPIVPQIGDVVNFDLRAATLDEIGALASAQLTVTDRLIPADADQQIRRPPQRGRLAGQHERVREEEGSRIKSGMTKG